MPTQAQVTRLKKKFLEHFSVHGNITQAAAHAGIERKSVYNWQERDEAFALAFREAEIMATEHLEVEARRRAVEGVQRLKFDKFGTSYLEKEYSDTLLIFLLKARNPAKYRDNSRVELTGEDGGPISIDTDPYGAIESRMAGLVTRIRVAELHSEPVEN